MGHDHDTPTYRLYAEGAVVKPLYDAVSAVDYGIDHSHLIKRRK